MWASCIAVDGSYGDRVEVLQNWLSAAVSPALHGKWTGWCVNLLSVEIRKACRICLNYLKPTLQRKTEINQGSETETLLWNQRYNLILKATLYWECLPKEGSNPLLKPSHAQAKQEQCKQTLVLLAHENSAYLFMGNTMKTAILTLKYLTLIFKTNI